MIVSQIINQLVWQKRELSYDEILEIANCYDLRIAEWIDLAQNELLSSLRLDDPQGMGYTLRSLAAALWCYWHSSSFEDGLFAIVNEGGDADTNAAIACAILGAKFGYKKFHCIILIIYMTKIGTNFNAKILAD